MNNPLNNPKYVKEKNAMLQLLDRESRRHVGCFRFNKKFDGETKEHVMKKFQVVVDRLEENPIVEFWSEIRSADLKHRADLLFVYPPTALAEVVEIAKTEKEESLLKKDAYWTNLGFDYTVIRCNQ